MIKMESSTYLALVSTDAFVDLKPALEKYGQIKNIYFKFYSICSN